MSRERVFSRSYRSQYDDSTSIASSSVLSRQDSLGSFSVRQSQQLGSPQQNLGDSMATSDLGASYNKPQKGSKSTSASARKGAALPGQLPNYKAGRVKVGIRCRPAFQDEVDFAQGQYMSIVETKHEKPDQNLLGQVSLTLMSGKQRDFLYDYVFGSNDSQDSVYDRIARPVVTDVLKGFNGTIFAYGQTGTGKTYTMGILEFVHSDHAGIIPRAISQIFDYVESQPPSNEITVSLSFLQLYRETIQDLLAPASGSAVGEDNLAIREDPRRGFYVEGLQEFVVTSYSEAEALLNLGLENRAIAPTLMNSTSSRSHTVLTLNIEQRGMAGGDGDGDRGKSRGAAYNRTVRSKLLMVDLAGSERVRRTVSKGTRLSEAKSINTSLSALGNVIAALADTHAAHVPYRDSKLTRLLQDSLGGTASTALVATVGPAAINYGETLSTLLFATRCMAVKTTPIQHEEIDYADLCARLQERVGSMEAEYTEKMLQQQEKYESIIRDLNSQLNISRTHGSLLVDHSRQDAPGRAFDSSGLDSLMRHLTSVRNGEAEDADPTILSYWTNTDQNGQVTGDDELLALLGYCYEVLAAIATDTVLTLEANCDREEAYKQDLVEQFAEESHLQNMRENEKAALEDEDPWLNGDKKHAKAVGSHLAPLSKLEALNRVEGHYRSNNDPVAGWDRSVALASGSFKPSIADYEGPQELAEALARMHNVIQQNVTSAAVLMARKDEHYKSMKEELADHLMDKRKREEEVVNWSFILKYLLSSSSKLRKQLQKEKRTGSGRFVEDSPSAEPFSTSTRPPVANNFKPFEPLQRQQQAVPVPLRKGFSLGGGGEENGEEDFDDLISEIAAGANAVKGETIRSTSSMSDSGSRATTPSLSIPSKQQPRSVADPSLRSTAPFNAKPAQHELSPLDRVKLRMEQSKEQEEEDLRLQGLQGRLGPRLMRNQQAVNQNYASASAASASFERGNGPGPHEDGDFRDGYGQNTRGLSDFGGRFGTRQSTLGGVGGSGRLDDDRYSVDEASELTFTNATLNSEGSTMHSSRDQPYGARGLGRPKYLDPVAGFRQTSSDSLPSSAPPSVGSNKPKRSRGAAVGSDATTTSKGSTGQPSTFAKHVVEGLGVEKGQEAVAMSIVDRVTKISAKQLSLLDPETRAQIMQIRQELGLEALPSPTDSNSSRASSKIALSDGGGGGGGKKSPQYQGDSSAADRSYITPGAVPNQANKRASSAPKLRPNSSDVRGGGSGGGGGGGGRDRMGNSGSFDDSYTPSLSRGSRADIVPDFRGSGRGFDSESSTGRPSSAGSSRQRRNNIPTADVDLSASGRRPSVAPPPERDLDDSARARLMAEARRQQRNGDSRYSEASSNDYDDYADPRVTPAVASRASRSAPKPAPRRQQPTTNTYYDQDGDGNEDGDGYSQLDEMDFY